MCCDCCSLCGRSKGLATLAVFNYLSKVLNLSLEESADAIGLIVFVLDIEFANDPDLN